MLGVRCALWWPLVNTFVHVLKLTAEFLKPVQCSSAARYFNTVVVSLSRFFMIRRDNTTQFRNTDDNILLVACISV